MEAIIDKIETFMGQTLVTVTYTQLSRPIQTRSRFASGTEYLKLARYYNSPDRSTKSTSSLINEL